MTDRSERGSLIIAMAVVLVLSGLALAVLARTLSAVASTRRSQDTASAISLADAGIADALSVLDQYQITGPFPAPCCGAPQWSALFTDAFTGTLTSRGTANGISHTATVQVTRAPWVVETAGSLVLDGVSTVSANARLAAGGALVLRNGASGGGGQDLLGPGASCSGCSPPPTPPSVLPAITFPDPGSPPLPPTSGPCPTIIAALPVLPSPFVCTGPLIFSGLIPPNPVGSPPTEIYVVGDGASPASVTFSGGADINTSGDPNQLIVHVVGGGSVDPTSLSRFTGIIDAPESSLRSPDCEFTLVGAADLGSLDCQTASGGLGPTFTLDSRAALPGEPWREANYQDGTGP